MSSALFADDDDRINFFFEAPPTRLEGHRRAGLVSTLFLLRREMMDCMGYDPESEGEDVADAGGVQHRVFASALLMFTTFDLLAKFMGGDAARNPGERFQAFLSSRDGGRQNPHASKILWQVRNSMVHAFGLPTPDKLKPLELSSVRLVVGTPSDVREVSRPMATEKDGAVAVHVDGVYRVTRDCVRAYRATLHRPEAGTSRATFRAMFEKYGTIGFLADSDGPRPS